VLRCGAAAAERRAAINQYLTLSGAPHQTRNSGVQQANGGTDGQTDRQTPGRHIDPAPHTMWAVLFCSLAVLDPKVVHTMDVLSPFISVLCHSD